MEWGYKIGSQKWNNFLFVKEMLNIETSYGAFIYMNDIDTVKKTKELLKNIIRTYNFTYEQIYILHHLN